MADIPTGPVRAVDAKVPSPARIYDYYLGGSDNYAVDREIADIWEAAFPTVRAAARSTRGFLLRATRFIAERGVRQFLDIGCGIPLAPNVHDIARSVHVDARVVYVDNDAIVLAKGQALRDEPGVITVPGDLRDPGAIVRHPDVLRTLDFTQPIGVLTVAVWHFLPEDAVAAYQARLREALAPGSYLALSHACPDHIPRAEVDAGEALYRQTSNPVRARTRDEIAALLDGFTIVEPGLVPLGDWRPVEGDPYPERALEALGGVGVLPAR